VEEQQQGQSGTRVAHALLVAEEPEAFQVTRGKRRFPLLRVQRPRHFLRTEARGLIKHLSDDLRISYSEEDVKRVEKKEKEHGEVLRLRARSGLLD